MRILEIQFTPWYKKYYFKSNEESLKLGDYVVVETELGTELGEIKSFKTEEEVSKIFQENGNGKERSTSFITEIKPIARKATSQDLDKVRENEAHYDESFNFCHKLIKKHELPMKLVDIHFSYDGKRITFAFIADGRVDFRELVKDLTRKFQKSVRMHQIGVRDEAQVAGDIGPCGRILCCKKILKSNYGGITTEMAYAQQVAHRGLERLSGQCGRLKCCLKYELSDYEELRKNLPVIDSIVKTSKGKGKVVGWEILRQAVKVDLGDKTIVEVPLKEIKK